MPAGAGGDNPPATTDAADKYIGAWVRACTTDGTVQQTINGTAQSTNSKTTYTGTKVSSSSWNAKVVISYYAPADSQCTGAPIYTITKTGENTGSSSLGATAATSSLGQNLWTIAATVTADGASADQVTYSESALVTGISGSSTSVTVGGNITLNTSALGSYTDKYLVKVSGNTLTMAFDSSGDKYATTFTPSPTVSIYTLTKQ